LALLVALEGIDGSGKGTQALLLQQRLVAAGLRARLLSFPRYDETLFGKSVGDFLNGRFGALDEVNPFLVSLLYAGDRFESRELLQKACAENDVLVIDRFVASNIAHQGAKLDECDREEFVEWIGRIEHEVFQLPRPDLVVLLDLPADQAQQLIARKQARGYTDKAADIQEANQPYLAKVRDVYLHLSSREPNWHRVDCYRDDAIRAIDDIAAEIWRVVRDRQQRDAARA